MKEADRPPERCSLAARARALTRRPLLCACARGNSVASERARALIIGDGCEFALPWATAGA